MIGYRVLAQSQLRRWQDAFTGEGAYLYGGRWSSIGTRVVYASTHLSLASLEVLVHANRKGFRGSRVALRFEIDDALVMRLHKAALPRRWNALPAPVSAQKTGDAWVRSGASLGLLVPTAMLPNAHELEVWNLLINPQFPACLSHIMNPTAFAFDFDSGMTEQDPAGLATQGVGNRTLTSDGDTVEVENRNADID